jgi:hypothetical protein
MQDNLILMGINAPRQHQAIITKLIYGLTELYVQGNSKLFPYPETMIDESQTSPVPDILLVDTATDLTKVIIEITHTQGVKKDLQKLMTLMQDYEVEEGFVYDYKLKIWHKYLLQENKLEQENSFSTVLQQDLNALIISI